MLVSLKFNSLIFEPFIRMTLSTDTRSKGQRVLRLCVGVIPPVQRGVMLAASCPITIKQVKKYIDTVYKSNIILGKLVVHHYDAENFHIWNQHMRNESLE